MRDAERMILTFLCSEKMVSLDTLRRVPIWYEFNRLYPYNNIDYVSVEIWDMIKRIFAFCDKDIRQYQPRKMFQTRDTREEIMLMARKFAAANGYSMYSGSKTR